MEALENHQGMRGILLWIQSESWFWAYAIVRGAGQKNKLGCLYHSDS